MVTGICMNEYLILREDIKIEVEDNLIKIKATPVYGKEDTLVFISKSQAVILLLFDGTSSVGGICEKVASLFNTDLEKGEYTILKTLELFGSLLTPLNGWLITKQSYLFPTDFPLPNPQIEYSFSRMAE